MKVLHIIAFILLIIGGLNWLLVAFGSNLVDGIFEEGSPIAIIIYALIGLAAIVEIFTHKKNCRACTTAGSSQAL